MRELTFFLGFHVKKKKDDIFISQDKYAAEILKKFTFKKLKTVSTPMESQKPLLKDGDSEEVDVRMYRSMIGSLMYLTSSRPYIMFVVCACTRYHVNPKVSHLYAMKRFLGKAKKSVRLMMEKLFGMELKLMLVMDIAQKDKNEAKRTKPSTGMERHAPPEDIHELLCKLLKDLKIINKELAEYINSPSWNCPTFYDDNDDEYSIQYREYLDNSSNTITYDLPNEEPNNSLSMGDVHLSTILETELDEIIKSSVKNLVLILSESEGISNDTCDDIDYIEASPHDSELVSLEEVKDDILHEKLLNINLLIDKIEYLNDNSTSDCVLKSPFPFPILVEDSDSFFEKSDTSLSYSDNSLPEFETFIDHTEETSSGSTTTHAGNSLFDYDSFLFEIKPDQGELTSVVMEDILVEPHVHVSNVLPTHPTFMLDSEFIPSDDPLGFDLKVSFLSRTRNKIFDPRISFEIPMMIFRGDIPFLDDLFLHFYPP
nr:hypothetical protein [Tanacetum cinerariifolium]